MRWAAVRLVTFIRNVCATLEQLWCRYPPKCIFCCHWKEIMKCVTFITVIMFLIAKIRGSRFHGPWARKELRCQNGFMYGDLKHSGGNESLRWKAVTSVNVSNAAFWVVTPCNPVCGCQGLFTFWRQRRHVQLKHRWSLTVILCYTALQPRRPRSTCRPDASPCRKYSMLSWDTVWKYFRTK